MSGIANNINQITRLANTVKSVSPAQVEELQRLCSEALSLVKESL
ncbi:plasmid mobilization relaxosome protein MobC [Ruthenibacterium lactatiformans]